MSERLHGLPAPAKLNLFLHVTGRRADGYHLLETVFQLIDLNDTIDLDLRHDGVIHRSPEWPGIASNDCLTVRAARALQAHPAYLARWGHQPPDRRPGVDITLTKHIPHGAGLGGGSSDAATVLMGLNTLWHCGLDRTALQQTGLQLGADVPVFVGGCNAYATGVGEILQPIALPPLWFVVAKPHAHVATASVFQAPDLTRETKPITMPTFQRILAGNAVLQADSLCCTREALQLPGQNDLEKVVLSRNEAVARALRHIQETAEKCGVASLSMARMTGSGSALFVASRLRDDAMCLATALTGSGKWQWMSKPQNFASSTAAVNRKECVSRGTAPCDFGSVAVVPGLSLHPLGSRQVG